MRYRSEFSAFSYRGLECRRDRDVESAVLSAARSVWSAAEGVGWLACVAADLLRLAGEDAVGLDTPEGRAAGREMLGWLCGLGGYLLSVGWGVLLTLVAFGGSLAVIAVALWLYLMAAAQTWRERRRAATLRRDADGCFVARVA